RWGVQKGPSPRPGRQSPTPEPPGAARAHFARPSGQTLAAPGEPGVAPEVPDRGDDLTPCPLRARRGGEPRGTAVTRGQGDTVTPWSEAGSTRGGDDLLSLGYPLVGCPFRAENQGRLLPADADCCLIAEVVSKPGAGGRFTGRSVSLRLRHVAHCCIARVAGMDWRRCLWI